MNSNQPETLESTIDEADLTIGRCIGSGASGHVHRATWKSVTHGEIEVAAKKIFIPVGQKIVDVLGKEILFLQRLDHPNIIKYYGHVVTEDFVVIVTEHAAKGSLFDYLRGQRSLPPDLELKWAIQAARGIKYLHENKILHRDIKSPNLLITADDDLKICDFGIAKELSKTKTTTSAKGTSRWLAPEVFKDQKLSHRADIFSFGIVLWELDTCEIPYDEIESWRLEWVVGRGERPKIPATCPPVFRNLMQQCWDEERANRPSLDEIIQQLQSRGLPLWYYKHSIGSSSEVVALNWIHDNQLTVCETDCVKVFEVTADSSRLSYTLTCDEWYGREIRGAAVSESLPGSIMVICKDQPYVYQYPTKSADQETKRFDIQGQIHWQIESPWCIVANDTFAVIHMANVNSFIVCQLPDFRHQFQVETSFLPLDLSMISEHVLVMGERKLVIKSLSGSNRVVDAITPPEGWLFSSVSCRNDGREIYAACNQGLEKGCVYKYTWNGEGTPSYVNAGCIINGLEWVRWRCLSWTPNGLLAVGQPKEIKLYSVE